MAVKSVTVTNMLGHEEEMTNEFITIIHRPPIHPETIVLWCSWLLASVTAAMSSIVGVTRFVRGKSLATLASANVLVALISGLGCLSALLWATGRLLQLQATWPTGVAASAMLNASWAQTFMLASSSVAVCGINAVIGVALTLNWKDPQPSAAPVRESRGGSRAGAP